MGIKRLTTFLEDRYDPVAHPPTVLPPGSWLLIDASGWSFMLQAACVTAGVRQDHLGDYGALDRAAGEMVQQIRSAGLVPVLYCDGQQRQMKAAETKRRREQRDGKWELLQGTCLDGQRVQQKDLPEPPLMMRQVLATATARGVQLVQWKATGTWRSRARAATRRRPHRGVKQRLLYVPRCHYIRFDIELHPIQAPTTLLPRASRAVVCLAPS